LKLEPAGFIEGGVEKLLAFFADRQPPDLLAGSDVIEHIYDLPGFIKALQSLNPKLITAFSTACNPRNPFQRRRFQKIQLRDEYEGGTPDLHPLFAGQPLEPFILSRQHIIESKAANRLSATQIAAMAKATRGLKKADIELAVDVYLNTGKQPQPPQDPTNTCDPITGSWSERMLPLQVYQELYQSAGFFLTVRDGFYNQYDARKSSLLRWMANRLIPFSAHTVAPYIILVGKPHA